MKENLDDHISLPYKGQFIEAKFKILSRYNQTKSPSSDNLLPDPGLAQPMSHVGRQAAVVQTILSLKIVTFHDDDLTSLMTTPGCIAAAAEPGWCGMAR